RFDALAEEPLPRPGFGRERAPSLDTAREKIAPTRDERRAASASLQLPITPSSRPPLAAYRRARRVRPNAATAHAASLDAAMAAGDGDALATLDCEDMEVIDHPTGATYDRLGNLASRRMMLHAHDLKFRHEPLATLGDSLALLRLSFSAGGVARGRL